MNRNSEAPRFEEEAYAVSITETFPLLGEVIALTATDPDGDPVTYELLQDDDISLEYFFIDDESGVVALRRSLQQTSQSSFALKVTSHLDMRAIVTVSLDCRANVAINPS